MLAYAQAVWRKLPASVRKGAQPILRPIVQTLAILPVLRRTADPAPGPIVVSGFMNANLGIGRAARMIADTLAASGYEIIRHDLQEVLREGRIGGEHLPGEPKGVWLLVANPPEVSHLLTRFPRAEWMQRRRIGVWMWELPQAPQSWLALGRLFDEIWAPSEFTAVSLRGVRTPLRIMPLPVPVSIRHSARARFQLLEDHTYVLAAADLRSTGARKNPLGALQVFTQAFPTPQSKVTLILKIRNGDDEQGTRDALLVGTARDDVLLLEREFSDEEMTQFIASIDLYLSLHRSEGFGLGIAEAMAQSKPVIATGWSGNIEFMRGMHEMLVPFSLTPVKDPSGVYRGSRQYWAEPNLDSASQMLKRLCDDPVLRARLGSEGRVRIEEMLSKHWSRSALDNTKLPEWTGGDAER